MPSRKPKIIIVKNKLAPDTIRHFIQLNAVTSLLTGVSEVTFHMLTCSAIFLSPVMARVIKVPKVTIHTYTAT